MSRNGEAVPVIAGLAIGIAFILAFSSLFANLAPSSSKDRIILKSKPEVSTVIIPEGASLPGGNFEPEIIKVVIGTNNTVRWFNEDTIPYTVASDTEYKDPYSGPFYSEGHPDEKGGPFVMPGHFFEYTFPKAGVFGYHSVPHPQMKGTVVVLAPGMADKITKSLIDERLRQKIEGMPLTVFIGDELANGALPAYAVQGFVLDKPTNIISTYQINPSWLSSANQVNINSATSTSAALIDRNGNLIPYENISYNNTILTFDAICPSSDMTIGIDGRINQIETDEETTVTYGPKVMMHIIGHNVSGIMYYNYSLGQVKPDENGIYRLTFVTPYEASITLSEDLPQAASYERANCNIVGSREEGPILPYYDIILDLRARQTNESVSK